MALGMVKEKKSEEQKEVKLHPEEIKLAKRDLLDLVLRELLSVENFWRYRYRTLVGMGIGISYESSVDVGEADGGLIVLWNLRVHIPEELWVKLAKLRKQRKFKFPKPHPVTRQKYRRMEEELEEEEEELSARIRGYGEEGEDIEGD